MFSDVNIADLIKKGGVFKEVEGTSPSEVYEHISELVSLPDYISSAEFVDALCQREQVLSTAVGNGIAMPHAQASIIKNPEDQKIAVCYLRRAIDMNAPDGIRVFVMFVLLTSGVQPHLQVISALAKVLHRQEVKKALERCAGLDELLRIIEGKN
ncbi:MAG: PTS sugar transporter subunit IIA [Treponema sp.]|nr:PTS sugar transporter subunit IIA [Treponema sp.]